MFKPDTTDAQRKEVLDLWNIKKPGIIPDVDAEVAKSYLAPGEEDYTMYLVIGAIVIGGYLYFKK
jgi:hypothetical protein